MRDLHPLGQMPPLGEVPARMLAQLIRPERFGEPTKAFQVEEVEVPADLRPDEVLVWVMAAGVNYNNVWAALGVPVDVIKGRQKDPDYRPFHIGGSDASGIVWKVGGAVRNVAVGDHVVIHCGTWDPDDAVVRAGGDPMFGASFRIWGYETNWGSFAQFTRVQAHQCLPKPKHLTWEAAAAYMLVARRRTACSWRGRRTPSSPATSCSCGAARAGLAARRSRSRGRWAARPWPSCRARTSSSSASASAPRAASTARSSRTGACCPTGRIRRS